MKKKKRLRICYLIIAGFIPAMMIAAFIGGVWPYITALAYIVCAFCVTVAYVGINSTEPQAVPPLPPDGDIKLQTIRKQTLEIKRLIAECEAYRKERDEIHIREELYKKQMREMRGRVEYWRMKYRAIVNVEAAPTDEIETIPNTENE